MATKTNKTTTAKAPAKRTYKRKTTTTKSTASKAKAKATAKKGNLNKIIDTAKSVNKQVVDTTKEVLIDVIDQGVKISDEITDKLNEGVKFEGINIKKTASKVNNFALETTEEFSEAAFKTAEKWQKLTEKTVKDGLKLAGRQQTFVFDTLDAIKGQAVESFDRFKQLFSKN